MIPAMRQGVLGLLVIAVLAAGGMAGEVAQAQIRPADAQGTSARVLRIEVTIGKSQVLDFKDAFNHISVTNPAIADIFVVTPNQVLINGKAAGVTSLVALYPDKTMYFDVVVQTDIGLLKERLKTVAPRDEIRPAFSYRPDGGPDGKGSFLICSDEQPGRVGWWTKTFPIEGGKSYAFRAVRRCENVALPRRSVLARVIWLNADGKPAVRDALATLDANNGEIWAKLDAGTEEYFQLVDRPNVSLQVTGLTAGQIQACRGVVQPGSTPALGAGGRPFESGRPDHLHPSRSRPGR